MKSTQLLAVLACLAKLSDARCAEAVGVPGDVIAQSNANCIAADSPFSCCNGPGMGTCDKTRFISFTPPTDPVGLTALRVRLVSLHHVLPPYTGSVTVSFGAFEGQSVYVGPPSPFVESAASQIPFKSAVTRCQPYYYDWTTVGLVHVRGSAIVPSSNYTVEYLFSACMGHENEPQCQTGGAYVSPGTPLRTTRWGDVDVAYNPPASTPQPDFSDISAMVFKYRDGRVPIKARLIIAPNDPFGNISDAAMSVDFSFSHIAACVDAFRGRSYPAKMGKCATSNTACTMTGECGVDGPCNLYCP